MDQVGLPEPMQKAFIEGYNSSLDSVNRIRNEFWDSQIAFADSIEDYSLFLIQTKLKWNMQNGKVMFQDQSDLNEYKNHWSVINKAVEREEAAINAMTAAGKEKVDELRKLQLSQ